MTLATDYRPRVFEEVCEQKSVISILKYQVENDCPKNAYLFCGASGCGKTTVARCLATALNKGQGTPIERDVARNNGVDKARELFEEAQFQSLDCKYKIFILDECHCGTSEYFQALLKVLEEPPKNTIFIFCTTNPEKIPATILNRVQRFDFNKISLPTIIDRLKFILDEEMHKDTDKSRRYELEAVEFVARMSNGGMRDAISLLEKCLDYSKELTMDNVIEALGYIKYETLFEIVNSIKQCDLQTCISEIENIYMSGVDLKFFVTQLLNFVLDLCVYSITRNFEYINIPQTMREQIDYLTDNGVSAPKNLLKSLLELSNEIKYASNPKLIIESSLVILCN